MIRARHLSIVLGAALAGASIGATAGATAGAAASTSASASATASRRANATDPRLREITYDPLAVVTVPVKRGVVTLIALDADEAITEVATGLGADCAKTEAAWCVAAQPGGRNLFVKPKSTAAGANTLAVVTTRRIHSFQLVVLAGGDPRPAVYRLAVHAPAQQAQQAQQAQLAPLAQASQTSAPSRLNAAAGPALVPVSTLPPLPALPTSPSPQQIVAERLQAAPEVMNTQYSIAEGKASQDIVPALVFDDGRFTYLRFPGNRELPSVFHVLPDGSETLVNTHMEDELMVIDRVSRRLVLRAGTAAVGIWNERFDLDGRSPENGTTVPGVRRVLKAGRTAQQPGPAATESAP